MPYDDLGIVVGRDDGSGVGSGMIQGTEPIGQGSIILLESSAVGGISHDRSPQTVLREGILRANEARRCDRAIGDHHDRNEEGSKQTERE
jgi:hypothetical protein